MLTDYPSIVILYAIYYLFVCVLIFTQEDMSALQHLMTTAAIFAFRAFPRWKPRWKLGAAEFWVLNATSDAGDAGAVV